MSNVVKKFWFKSFKSVKERKSQY